MPVTSAARAVAGLSAHTGTATATGRATARVARTGYGSEHGPPRLSGEGWGALLFPTSTVSFSLLSLHAARRRRTLAKLPPEPPPMTPAQKARRRIDEQLARCGWQVQDYADLDIFAATGVAVGEFPLKTGS